jgi:hypothetical protein
MRNLLNRLRKFFRRLIRIVSLILTTIYVISVIATGTALIIFKTWDYSPLLTIAIIASVFYVVFKIR